MENFITPTAPQEQRRLVVLHVDTERGWRGGERQVLWLAEGLSNLGDGSVIAARAGEPLADRARAAGLSVTCVTPAFEGDPRAAWHLRRVIRKHDVDVVHAHTAHAAALGALATLGTRVPLVVARRVDFQLRRGAFTRWKYRRASVIVAVSQAVGAIVERSALGVPIVVIPDGTDVRRTRERATPDVLAALGVAAGAPLVVQVAQLVPHKDPLTFVRAVSAASKRNPKLRALLVGDGPLRAAVDAEIGALGLQDVLRATGYRDDADRLLASADVVTLSSREEGMGSVLLDALVYGRPVAATRAGGIPEVVRHGETGLLVPVGDAESLGGAIHSLIADPALAARLGAAARARAPEFSVEAMAMRTRALYERVLAGRRPRESR